MPFFDGTREILLFVFGGVAGSVFSFGLFDRWRGRRRNIAGTCARCGAPWASAYPAVDRFLVQGREVCSPCAASLRARLPRLLKWLAGTGVVGAAWISFEFSMGLLHGNSVSALRWLVWLSGPVGLTGATLIALTWSKRQNQKVLRDSAAAPFLEADTTPDSLAPGA